MKEIEIAETLEQVAALWVDDPKKIDATDKAWSAVCDQLAVIGKVKKQGRMSKVPAVRVALRKLQDEHRETLLAFHLGSLTIRTRPEKSAILAAAAKFRGGGVKPFKMGAAYRKLQCVGPYDWRRIPKPRRML